MTGRDIQRRHSAGAAISFARAALLSPRPRPTASCVCPAPTITNRGGVASINGQQIVHPMMRECILPTSLSSCCPRSSFVQIQILIFPLGHIGAWALGASGGTLVLLVLAALALYRGWRYEQELDSLLWKIDFRDLHLPDEEQQANKLSR